MQHLEVSGAVRHVYIYIYVIRRLKVNIYKKTSNTLHVSGTFCVHPQEHLKTVVTASGI